MSILEKYLAGLTFRSNTPRFDAGDELELFVTGRADGAHVVRVGDSTLRLDGAPADALDTKVRLRVTGFDTDDHVGEADYLETVGESAF
ncbi:MULTISPECIES: hypothetical protein [Halobacterium]|uniref:DUF7513 domain-containing protein n=4 Tax=Halobacterium salinarum TaxID=2242 RepID=Q9HS27_HALSA|nr:MULTISPECIES: hypothetical protein [Halobacterium]AAG18981.1 hypothetical protein VNG_0435H [Halobacterium salinarum NRC-1]MBB6089814.1 hypothetical protein [Halobacterium salinarum]MCF2164095.1 hypothetical protein [Halobacterium salinarum]MCF2167829.1 hypothetical protein [Halobacterium salinarum]MCF2207664.1 hypothetical protein [Halobacterium salinarum]